MNFTLKKKQLHMDPSQKSQKKKKKKKKKQHRRKEEGEAVQDLEPTCTPLDKTHYTKKKKKKKKRKSLDVLESKPGAASAVAQLHGHETTELNIQKKTESEEKVLFGDKTCESAISEASPLSLQAQKHHKNTDSSSSPKKRKKIKHRFENGGQRSAIGNDQETKEDSKGNKRRRSELLLDEHCGRADGSTAGHEPHRKRMKKHSEVMVN